MENQKIQTPKLGRPEVHTVGESGALSSGHKLPLWMVPLSLIKSCARRMLNGILPKDGRDPYPVFNWRKGIGDVQFVRDRTAHAAEHLWCLQNGITDEDTLQEHLDAVTWWCAFMNESMRLYPEVAAKAFYSEAREEIYQK